VIDHCCLFTMVLDVTEEGFGHPTISHLVVNDQLALEFGQPFVGHVGVHCVKQTPLVQIPLDRVVEVEPYRLLLKGDIHNSDFTALVGGLFLFEHIPHAFVFI
jgi:hypothetical protein